MANVRYLPALTMYYSLQPLPNVLGSTSEYDAQKEH